MFEILEFSCINCNSVVTIRTEDTVYENYSKKIPRYLVTCFYTPDVFLKVTTKQLRAIM